MASQIAQQTEIGNEIIADEKRNEEVLAEKFDDEKKDEEQLADIIKDIGEEKVELYRLTWEMFDKENKGEVTREDFAKVLEKIYENETEEERNELVKQMDANEDGNISYIEYLKFMRDAESAQVDGTEEDALKEAFDIADKDNDGYIDIKELQALIKDLGEDLTEEQVRPLLELADKNKDGVISYDEFKVMF